ncbi:MAG TPA: Mur ligase family protein, partial [Perlabentimonas sp.]|nr:Mur ligase family protein [Perlabentimonas sp.]
MDYQQTLSYLFTQLAMYQRVGKIAYKANLNNTLALDNLFSHPHKNFKTVHVAGTNGKGSTSHMLASILQNAGYKVGLYTSPHLVDFRERIKINGIPIDKDTVIDFVEKNKSIFATMKPSFFEMTVALAFKYFAEQEVDIAVVEVGLGGRLDSTNIISPELSVITNIGLDHTDMLGDTLELIAAEKAGIIKPNTPVVICETQPETQNIFIKKAHDNSAPIE